MSLLLYYLMMLHLQLAQCMALPDIPLWWFMPEVQTICAPIRAMTAPAEPVDAFTVVPM